MQFPSISPILAILVLLRSESPLSDLSSSMTTLTAFVVVIWVFLSLRCVALGFSCVQAYLVMSSMSTDGSGG